MNRLYPLSLSPATRISPVVTDAQGAWLYAATNPEQKWRFGVKLSKLDPLYLKTLLAFEDQRFWQHWGMDPLAMSRAVWQLLKYRHITSGGSTITMQLARLLEPKPRTVRSKIIEIIRAFQLESTYSKEQILQAYLTLAPYGGNIEGLSGASMRYFGKLPYSLTPAEAALLVCLPQAPESNRPDRHPTQSHKARNKVLKVALKQQLISPALYQQATQEPLPSTLHPYPRLAPHLSQKLLQKRQTLEIPTTLNHDLQQQLEIWAHQQGAQLPKGTTLSLLIAHNPTAQIRAYLGSHDMFSPKVAGFVDMVPVMRSPGSTLKPFVYALGFEQHLVHPNTLILDRETRFGDYLPHNYSREYHGEVSITYALQHSLNIPVVKLLERLGAETFVQRIRRFGARIPIPRDRATLPVALGGLGISLWEMTQLYVALAQGGKSAKLHLRPPVTNQTTRTTLLTPEAAQMTTAILREVTPPKGHHDPQNLIAYKTGTSYGYRDLWTIAYTPEYTVALWLGRPDNATQLKHSALELAAPLAFEVIEMLQAFAPLKPWSWQSNYLGNQVPTGLRRFDQEPSMATEPLRFIHPPEGTRYRSAGCHDVIAPLTIAHGTPPYHWYIDDQAIPTEEPHLKARLGAGGHSISIIDTTGHTINRNIWVDMPACR
jgi:penicillin-binding protein 1C